jgi:hypothetical protein
MLTKNDLQAIDGIVTKRIRQELKPVNKKVDLLISFFDREIVSLKKRVGRIEGHIHLPTTA